MSRQYTGSCLCGTLQFSFTGPLRFVSDCVCESCRRAHGAAAVCWAGVDAERFRIEAGQDGLQWYRSSAAAERGFCRQCGTRVLFRSGQWPGEIHIAVAAIATPHDLVSAGVAFKSEFPAWSALSIRGAT